MDDPRLEELSGLVTADGGLWAMADGGRRVQLHRLDPATCAVTDTRTADIDPSDPEDLALGPDSSFWVGDIGDNGRDRRNVAVIVVPASGEPRLHRLTYPDGPHDAEALLVDRAGRPVIVTKDAGPAGIYRTESAPDGVGPTPLVRVGQVTLPGSDTVGGPVGGVGTRVVTGAGASTDGNVVALRTYTDAWLFAVADDDVAAALGGVPVRVPLPGEPQGEAVTFDADGTLLSGSEARGGTPGTLRAVAGASGLVGPGAPAAESPSAAPAGEPAGESRPAWLPAAVGGAAVVAVLLLVAGAIALRNGLHSRRRRSHRR